MKEDSKTELKKKGWSEDDIFKAEKIIEERKTKDKSGSTVHSNRVLFWTILFVIIKGNLLISFGLIPILLMMNHIGADIFVVVLGFLVGILFNFLVWDVEEHLTKKHHLIATTIIPLLAIFNLYLITNVTNSINTVFKISTVREDPLMISALYVIAFLTPYLWTLFYKKKIKPY